MILVRFERCLLALFIVAAIFATVEGAFFFRELRIATVQAKTDLHAEAMKFDAVQTDISRDMWVIGKTVINVEKGTRPWQKQQNQLAAQALSAETQLTSDLRDLDTLESSLNSMIVQQSAWLHGSEESVSLLMKERIQPSLIDIQKTAANSADASQTLSTGLIATMPQIEETAENANKTVAHIEGTTKDVQDFTHRELAPVKGTWNAIKAFLFEIAGPAASVATSLK